MVGEAATGSLFTFPQELAYTSSTPGTEVSLLCCSTDMSQVVRARVGRICFFIVGCLVVGCLRGWAPGEPLHLLGRAPPVLGRPGLPGGRHRRGGRLVKARGSRIGPRNHRGHSGLSPSRPEGWEGVTNSCNYL